MADLSQPHRAHPVIGEVQILAELINHLEASIAVLMQEAEQVLALDYRNFGVVEQLCGHLVNPANECGAQSENLARTCDAECQLAARFRAYRESCTALAKNEYTTSGVSLAEECRPAWIGNQRLQIIKFTEGVRSKPAEEQIGASYACQATALDLALHVP